jgi:hypothetical protein
MTTHARSAVRPSDAAACRPRKIERAQGRPGACRPHGPRAVKNARGRNHRFGRDIPALPARWVTAYTRSPQGPAFLPLSHTTLVESIANLTPAPGCQDHTTSPSASTALVRRSLRVHRIPPRVRDDRDPPLSSGETGRAGSVDLPDRLSEIFFAARLDGILGDLPVGLICRARVSGWALAREAKQRQRVGPISRLPIRGNQAARILVRKFSKLLRSVSACAPTSSARSTTWPAAVPTSPAARVVPPMKFVI